MAVSLMELRLIFGAFLLLMLVMTLGMLPMVLHLWIPTVQP